MALCNDLGVNPEDVVLLAIAYELKSPGVGEWPRKGWQEGWKNLGCDGTIEGMKTILPKQRQKLGKDSAYFNKVYSYTFDFAKSEGQRSLGGFSYFDHVTDAFSNSRIHLPIKASRPHVPFGPYCYLMGSRAARSDM